MRRGRWVVYCAAVFVFLFSARFSYGITLSMTATVPLSPQWKQALRIYSQAKIDTSRPYILLVTQDSLGIEKLPVEKQSIQLLIFKNNVLIDEQIKATNKKGVAEFIYVPNQSGTYLVLVVNKSDESPFVVKSATVAL